MKKHALTAAGLLSLTALLVACGGGGGGGTIGGPPPTNPPTAAPQTVTFSGKVTQLSGSLAHSPIACATATAVPCPSPGIPATPAPTPAAGAAIAGASVYVTTASGIFTNSIPNPILAQATTAPDGSFTTAALQLSSFSGNAGIVVINGTSVSPANGLTDKGYAVLHAQVPVSAGNVLVPNLEIDTLSSDETIGAPEVENVRSSKGLPPTVVDEYTLEAVRWSNQNNDGNAQSCALTSSVYTLFSSLGGVGTPSIIGDAANPTLPGAIDVMYKNPKASEVWAASTGPANEPDCGPNSNGIGAAYYQLLTVTP